MPDAEDTYLKDVCQTMAGALAEVLGPLLGSRPLLTIPQAASKLGVKVRTVEQMVRSGELASVKVRGARRIEQAEVDRFVAEQREAEDG